MKTIHLMAAASMLSLSLAAPSFAAVEGDQPGKVMPDMTEGAIPPKHMTIPAVPEGKNLKEADQHELLHRAVTDPNGQKIGTIEKLLTSKEGTIEYAEVSLIESNRLIPIPWNAFKVEKESVMINATREQLEKEGPTFKGGQSGDFEHKGGEPLKPHLRQGGG
jgi:PRC-barrel domain